MPCEHLECLSKGSDEKFVFLNIGEIRLMDLLRAIRDESLFFIPPNTPARLWRGQVAKISSESKIHKHARTISIKNQAKELG